MFERYTEKARRIIFFARYEASQFGSPYIETEHILLGLLREDKALTNRFLRSHTAVESIRKQIEAHTTVREQVSTSVDLPLSNESKSVLAFAAEEAERLSHKHIGTEHLLLGLLREEKCFGAQILHEHGLRLSTVREELASSPHQPVHPPSVARDSPLLALFCQNLTDAALNDDLDPVIGRDNTINGVVDVLCQRTRNSVVLVGEPGVGKSAIVMELAQRIADGNVPHWLSEKRILSLDLSSMGAGADRTKFEERFKAVLAEAGHQGAILFVPEVATLLASGANTGLLSAANPLRSALSQHRVLCVGEVEPEEYQAILEHNRWYALCSQRIEVARLNEADTLEALYALKPRYEKFHGVPYSDAAVQAAAAYCKGHIGKAVDLLDAAGARVKVTGAILPPEIIEVQKRIKFILHRMEVSIANHEFEKARFYSEEERKERENLRAVRSKFHLPEAAPEVTREHIERAIAQLEGLPH
jgi:ATP-dependent Clp protease ATP-binding subunit ClpC